MVVVVVVVMMMVVAVVVVEMVVVMLFIMVVMLMVMVMVMTLQLLQLHLPERRDLPGAGVPLQGRILRTILPGYLLLSNLTNTNQHNNIQSDLILFCNTLFNPPRARATP